MNEPVTVDAGSRMEMGVNRFPFSFPLKLTNGKSLLETYHGVYITISYCVHVTVERGVMARNLDKEIEYIVEVPFRKAALENPDPKEFTITPDSLENVRKGQKSAIPSFRITGKLHRQSCLINLPFTGEIVVEESETPIVSIELQLVRVELVNKALATKDPGAASNEMTREATEIESIQVGDGDVVRGMVIPLYLIFPRIYTTPSLSTAQFKVEFEVNLLVIFNDGYQISESFPISLHRTE
jgi:hypothetical protein